MPGTCRLPVSRQSHSRAPPGKILASLKAGCGSPSLAGPWCCFSGEARQLSMIPARCVCEIDTADMADGGSGRADTINSYPTRAACGADLRDHAVRLMKWRGRHGLRGRCDG
jgi:hypothetical protein